MFTGAALWLGRLKSGVARRISIALSLLTLLLGTATMLAYLTSLDLWIDLLFPDPASLAIGRAPGRMAELAALGFILLGLQGVLIAAERALWLREACALLTLAMAILGISAYSFGLGREVGELLTLLPLHTALVLLLATLGWLSSAPAAGLTRIAVADSLGGTLARYLILPSLLLPALLAFALKLLQQQLPVSDTVVLSMVVALSGGTVASMVIWVATLLDRVERQRRAYSALQDDANTDALTGLANRGAFNAALARLHRQAEDTRAPLSLVMLDLDHFKSYNDSFGHPAGDEVLRIVGRLLREVVRPQDVAARYGGEEFAVLLPHTDQAQAMAVASRVLENFRARRWPQRAITASIGVAAQQPGQAAAELLNRADKALYRSKQTGRDRASAAEPSD